MNENEKRYEAAKVAAIRQVQADPKVDTKLTGFPHGFIKGFEAAWVASGNELPEGVSA